MTPSIAADRAIRWAVLRLPGGHPDCADVASLAQFEQHGDALPRRLRQRVAKPSPCMSRRCRGGTRRRPGPSRSGRGCARHTRGWRPRSSRSSGHQAGCNTSDLRREDEVGAVVTADEPPEAALALPVEGKRRGIVPAYPERPSGLDHLVEGPLTVPVRQRPGADAQPVARFGSDHGSPSVPRPPADSVACGHRERPSDAARPTGT